MKKVNPKHHKKSAIALAVLAACQAKSQIGLAQETNQDEAAASNIEEVVVLGEFQQSLVNRIPIGVNELPFTLNVIDRDFLDARNFTRPIEALTTLPNITRTEDRLGTGTANFLSRGFEAPILVDNRPQNGFRGAGARDDSFVERYEVLKGPASISLGPIGAGGIINTVTKLPEADQSFGIEVRGDQFGSIGGEFDVNLGETLGPVFLLRINGAYRDFQFDADQTERQTFAIRPVVTADFGFSTSLKASVAYTDKSLNPNTGFPLLSNGEIPAQINTSTFTGFDNGTGDVEDILFEAEANHQFLDNLKLTVRGSQQTTDFNYQNTSGLYNYNYADGVPGIGLNDPYVYSYAGGAETESESTFFDAQLAYQAGFWGQQQDFVVGVAFDDSSFDRLFSDFPGVGPISLDNLDEPRIGTTDFGEFSPFTIFDQELNSAYVESALRPNDWLTIISGVRFDDLDQVTENFRGPNVFESAFDDNEVTFRVGGSAAVSETVNLYASFAQAFVPQFGVRRTSGPVEAETSTGFEIGVKGSIAEGLFSFDAGLFQSTRQDVAVDDPSNNAAASEFFVITVGEVELEGLEFSGNLNPLPGLALTLNVGYTDIEITEAGDDEVTAEVFPEFTGSSYISYELQAGALEGLRFAGGLRYVGEREGPVVDFGSYTVADVSVSYPILENTHITLDVLNVADELYLENSASFAQNITGGSVLGPPMTAVLTLRTKF